MLKVHPKFRIYGVGFADTIKDLVDEGFIEDIEIPQLNFITFYDNGDGGEYYAALHMCKKDSDDFIITVCNDELAPFGFIYL